MPRRVVVREFAFTEGEHGEADPRVLPDGFLTRAKNVRLRKDGRFGVRADYDALGTGAQTNAALVTSDVVGFNGGLLAIGQGQGGTSPPGDLFALTGTAQRTWRASTQTGNGARLQLARGFRDLGRPPSQTASVSLLDVAAAGGICCLVYGSGSDTQVHVFKTATDTTLDYEALTGISHPRVVTVGTKFFVVGLSGTTVKAWRFDPAVDVTLHALTDLSTGAAITHVDVAPNYAGDGFWLAVHRSTPTTAIIPVDGTGAAGSAVTGPATAFDYVTVAESSARLVLVAIPTASHLISIYSYLAGTLNPASPHTVFGATTTHKQPGVVTVASGGFTDFVTVFIEDDSTPHGVHARSVKSSDHTLGGEFIHDNLLLGTKPFTVPTSAGFGFLASGLIQKEGDGSYSNGMMQASNQIWLAYKDKFAAGLISAAHLPRVAYDTSTALSYWPNLIDDGDGRLLPVATEFSYCSTARRQTAALAGLLYIAGGQVEVYDGRQLVEAGFLEKPEIISATPSNGAGGLPSSTPLLVAATWEWRNSQDALCQSAVSPVTTVTMGASDDTITVVVTAPHSLRNNISAALTGGTVTVVLYRSIAGVNQLRRAESAQVLPYATAGEFAQPVTITMVAADAAVRVNGVIYTQAARGELSGTLEHEAPLDADYIWPFGSRLLTAGGSNRYQAQVSKEIFPGEPVNWSGSAGFLLPVLPEQITGVAALDARGLLFTGERIFQFAGDGPNANGEGGYSEPTVVPGSTGLGDWRSLVETPIGLFFQGSNGQLWVLPRDGSPPAWIGQPVRDTLVAYPVVTSATLVTDEQLVSFTCNNTGLTDSRLVHYDLRAKTWIVDEFATSTPIAAATSYQGRLAMVSGGIVYTERTSLTPSAFIEHALTTGPISLGGAGWRKFATLGLVGEYRGDCNLRCRVAYDQSQSFTTLHSFPLLASGGLSVGDTIHREWSPLRRKAEYLELVFEAITAGSASEGFVFNKYWIAAIPERGTSRSPAAQRG